MRMFQQHCQMTSGCTMLLAWFRPMVTLHPIRFSTLSQARSPTCQSFWASSRNRVHHIARAGAGGVDGSHKKIVFLGTPDVAAMVLKNLIEGSKHVDNNWKIEAVVTQPGRPKGRRNKGVPQPSPVFECAVNEGITEDRIFCPVKASEAEFLTNLKELEPDLCVTAAYGNYLPTRFLDIPRYGTLNIHPSLLPLYRGAAPVQRSLQDGVETTGVTVLYTVKEMDAGPIVAQTEYSVPETMQAPELLETLFTLGTQSLISCLPMVWDNSITPREQDHKAATHAAKMERSEAYLDFSSSSALACHNKVRAFVSWPGTYHTFRLIHSKTGEEETTDIKIIETRVRHGDFISWEGDDKKVVYNGKDAMLVKCGDGTVLEITKLQNPGKKPAVASAFNNGIAGRYSLFQS